MAFNVEKTPGTPTGAAFGNVANGKKCFRQLSVRLSREPLEPASSVTLTVAPTIPLLGATVDIPLVSGWVQTAAGFELNVPVPPAPGSVDVPLPLILTLLAAVVPSTPVAGTLLVSVPGGASVSYVVSGLCVGLASDAVAIDFVLDCSSSMKQPILSGDTRNARMRQAVTRALLLLSDLDWVGMVRMRNAASRIFALQPYRDTHRTSVDTALTSVATAATGEDVPTVLAAAMTLSTNGLNGAGACAPARRATVVVSDGQMNAPTPPAHTSYAIGTGTAADVDAAVLQACASSGSFFLLTNAPDAATVDRFRLDKYLVQTVADLAGFSIVLDPDGQLHGDEEVSVPFDLGDEDAHARMVLLVDDADLVRVDLHAPEAEPDDERVAQRASDEKGAEARGKPKPPRPPRCKDEAVDFVRTKGASRKHFDGYVDLAIDRSSKADPALRASGRWEMRFGLSNKAKELGARVKGVHYSAIVLARSDLKLHTEVTQDHYGVGATAFLTARLVEHLGPVDSSRAHVFAEIVFPDGGTGVLKLDESFVGRYAAELRLTQVGVYQFRIRAEGMSLAQKRFHRERTHTAYTAICARPCGRSHAAEVEPSDEPDDDADQGEEAAELPIN